MLTRVVDTESEPAESELCNSSPNATCAKRSRCCLFSTEGLGRDMKLIGVRNVIFKSDR